MSPDIFVEINNAVLDIQTSQLQTYERPLKRLSQLLKNPELKDFNSELTHGLDLEDFLKRSKDTESGMVGSARLAWPDDQKKVLGLTLLLIFKLGEDPNFATSLGYRFYNSGRKIISSIHALNAQLIIPFARDYKNYVQSHGSNEIVLKMQISKKIFIVHGRDDGARESVARFLERIGLEAIILHEQANQGRTVIEKVEAHGDVGFAVVLLTPDDEGCAKGGNLEPRARQNVLLELGYFIGRLGRKRVCALKRGGVEIPSDFAGVVWEEMDPSGGWKQSLARELKAAGQEIDWNKVMAF